MIPFDYITEWRAEAPWIAAEALISQRLVTLLPGDPWKGDDN